MANLKAGCGHLLLQCLSVSDYNGYVNELIQVFPCLIVACLSNHEYLVFCITGEH